MRDGLSIQPMNFGLEAALLAAQPGKEILRVDWLCQDFEFVALGTCLFQKVSSCCLPGEEQDLDVG